MVLQLVGVRFMCRARSIYHAVVHAYNIIAVCSFAAIILSMKTYINSQHNIISWQLITIECQYTVNVMYATELYLSDSVI